MLKSVAKLSFDCNALLQMYQYTAFPFGIIQGNAQCDITPWLCSKVINCICRELSRLHCKDGVGKVNWTCSKISRILRNATYKGYKCYLKSFCNNYLDQKRIKNLDESSYLYIKGDFEPIVSEELWDFCNELRKSKSLHLLQKDGTYRKIGKSQTTDPYLHKLRCVCGSKFRKNVWHSHKDGTSSFGYRCYNATNNGTRSKRIEDGLDTEGYCDGHMICDWKFDVMASAIFSRIWREKREAVLQAYDMINRNFVSSSRVSKEEIAGIEAKIERCKKRLANLICMRADGEIEKEVFLLQKKKYDEEIVLLENDLTKSTESSKIKAEEAFDLKKIEERLNQLTSFEGGKVPATIIEEFVATIVSDEDGKHFSWYLTLDDDSYYKSICTVEGRKTSASLEVQMLQDVEKLPTFFRNLSFTQVDKIGRNAYERGVLHRQH